MKKIYITTGILMLSATFGFGQRNYNNMPTKAMLGVDQTEESSVKNNVNNTKAAGDIIWSEDFSGGFPAGWSKGGTTNAGADWVINSAPISATFTNTGPILSGSGGNHMLYFGETITPVADRNAYFQTDAIALTGQSSVTVRFDQKFRLCCASAAELNLVVSTDPSFSTTQTYSARGAVAINAMSADPLTTSINITNFVGGYTGNIYLRFHWASGASHYFWMVDDIEVIESENNDLLAFGEFYGSAFVPYTRIPVDQISPFDFAMQATNVGAVNQTNTTLNVDINSGLFTTSSAPTTIPAMVFGGSVAASSDSLFTTTQFTPSTSVGIPYNATLTISSADSTDNTPANNTFTFPPFEVSQYIYALDDFGTPGAGGGNDNNTTPPTEEFEAGNFFDIYTTTPVYSIDVVIGTGTPVGTAIDVVLYDVTSGSFVEIDRSNIYVTVAGDVGTTKTLYLPNTPTVTAGSNYFAAVHCFTEFFYGTSGTSPGNPSPSGAMSLIFYPNMTAPGTGQNFFTTRTPMVRMNFENPLSVDEEINNVNFSVYPNPSNGEFTVKLNSTDSKNVNMTIQDVVGKTIVNRNITVSGKTVETISLTDYSKGIYFLTIDNNTTKLVVE